MRSLPADVSRFALHSAKFSSDDVIELLKFLHNCCQVQARVFVQCRFVFVCTARELLFACPFVKFAQGKAQESRTRYLCFLASSATYIPNAHYILHIAERYECAPTPTVIICEVMGTNVQRYTGKNNIMLSRPVFYNIVPKLVCERNETEMLKT